MAFRINYCSLRILNSLTILNISDPQILTIEALKSFVKLSSLAFEVYIYRNIYLFKYILFNKLFRSVDGFALCFYAVHHIECTQESYGQNTGGREVLKARGKGTRISRD